MSEIWHKKGQPDSPGALLIIYKEAAKRFAMQV